MRKLSTLHLYIYQWVPKVTRNTKNSRMYHLVKYIIYSAFLKK